MMAGLEARAARLAAGRQRERIRQIAGELRAMFGQAAVVTEDARVMVRGQGLIRRWLVDPNLRFLNRFTR